MKPGPHPASGKPRLRTRGVIYSNSRTEPVPYREKLEVPLGLRGAPLNKHRHVGPIYTN